MDRTILHFTSNVENESFENKIRANILKHRGDISIVSVSQKPIDFGKNICVGVHDNCYLNALRQIQIGLEEIKTPYVLSAEADFLYPPEYFRYEPTEPGRAYRFFGVWVCYYHHKDDPKPYFHFKGYSNGAQIISRDWWLGSMNWILKGRKTWATKDEKSGKRSIKVEKIVKIIPKVPIVTFKTKDSINKGTTLYRGVLPKRALPCWGRAIDLRKEMFDG